MPINEKIIEEINENVALDKNFKELLIDILKVQEKEYRYRNHFESLVNEQNIFS